MYALLVLLWFHDHKIIILYCNPRHGYLFKGIENYYIKNEYKNMISKKIFKCEFMCHCIAELHALNVEFVDNIIDIRLDVCIYLCRMSGL